MNDTGDDYSPVLKEKLLFSIQSLCEIGEELSSTEQFESSSQSILHLIMGTLVISKAAILLLDEGSREFRLVASRGVKDANLHIPLPDNALNVLHHRLEPILVTNPEHKVLTEYFEKNRGAIEQLHSHYWLPLRVKSRLLGVISVSKKFMGQDYEPIDLELLNIITQQLSIAVNNYYLIRDLKESNFQLNRKLLELETLYDLGIAIGSILDVSELAEQILINAVGLTDASAGFLALTGESGFDIASAINQPNDPAPLDAFEPVKAILEENEPMVDNGSGDVELPYGASKMLIVPLGGQREVLGVIGLADKESRDGLLNFTLDDQRMLQNFATQAGIAIENAKFYMESLEKERLERELQVAATIQRSILPDHPPEIDGVQIAAMTIPSRFVGGDHYDFHVRSGEYLFSIADVSGKGIPAALLVSTLHATQRALVESSEWDLRRIVKSISTSIHRSSLSNKFITFFLMRYDPAERTITTVNAGHNPPLLISSDGGIRKLTKGGLVLGLLPESPYECETTRLKTGDVIVTFTDGVNEAMNVDDEEFGDERFERVLVENRGKDAQEIHDAVMSALQEWTAGAPQHDDITLVVYKIVDPS